MSTLYEYYNTGADGQGSFGPVIWRAETFTPSVDHHISVVWLLLYRHSAASTPDTMTLELLKTDGTLPMGSPLVTATENGNAISTDSDGQWVEFTFNSSYLLTASTRYALRLRCATQVPTDPTFWKWDASGTYAGGQAFYTSNGGSTYNYADAGHDNDHLFEEYGAVSGGGSGGSIFPTGATIRVTSIIHRYNRGIYNMVLGLGEVVADFLVPATTTLTEKAYEADEVKAIQEEDKIEEQIIRVTPKIVQVTSPAPSPAPSPVSTPPTPYKPPFPPVGLSVGEITGMEEGGLAPIAKTTPSTDTTSASQAARVLAERIKALSIGVAPASKKTVSITQKKSKEVSILTSIQNLGNIAAMPTTTPSQRAKITRRMAELRIQLRELYE